MSSPRPPATSADELHPCALRLGGCNEQKGPIRAKRSGQPTQLLARRRDGWQVCHERERERERERKRARERERERESEREREREPERARERFHKPADTADPEQSDKPLSLSQHLGHCARSAVAGAKINLDKDDMLIALSHVPQLVLLSASLG